MRIKKFPLIAALIFSGAALAWGQTAADMEQLLDAGELTFSQAAYFTLASALENPPENPEAAFALAREKLWIPPEAQSGSALSLGDLSLLMVKVFHLEGGLLYRIFPGRRYAYRAMTGRGYIEGRSYSGAKVSGEQFLAVLGNVLAGREAE
jgi:hypothetical protein